MSSTEKSSTERRLTQRDTALHAFDLQRHVDQSLGIAAHIMEVLHILTRQRVVAGMEVIEDIELLSHEVPAQTDGPR